MRVPLWTGDCNEHGLRDDRKRADGEGMVLADFVAHPLSRVAQLAAPHVLALRVYSTAAFRSLNDPLRSSTRTGPHPLCRRDGSNPGRARAL